MERLTLQVHEQSQTIQQLNNLQQSVLKAVPSVAVNIWKSQNLGKLIFSASADRTVKMWSLETFEHLKTFIGHNGSINKLLVTSEHELVTCGSDMVKVWNIYSGENSRTIQVDHSIQDAVWWNKENSVEYLITCGGESEPNHFNMNVIKFSTGKTEKILKGHTETVNQLLIHEGNHLISCSDDQTIRIWNLETGKCLKTLHGHCNSIMCMVLFDNNTLISGCYDKSINFWNISGGNLIQTISNAHSTWIYSLALLPRQKMLLSASDDSTIKLWDLSSTLMVDKSMATLVNEPHEKHLNSIFSIKVLNNETQFLTGDATSISVWDLKTRTRVKVIEKAHHNCIRSFLTI